MWSIDMFAVIGRGLFYEVAPARFGTLGKAFFTLFQLITLDDWFYMYSDVVARNPGGLIFFLSSFDRVLNRKMYVPLIERHLLAQKFYSFQIFCNNFFFLILISFAIYSLI